MLRVIRLTTSAADSASGSTARLARRISVANKPKSSVTALSRRLESPRGSMKLPRRAPRGDVAAVALPSLPVARSAS